MQERINFDVDEEVHYQTVWQCGTPTDILQAFAKERARKLTQGVRGQRYMDVHPLRCYVAHRHYKKNGFLRMFPSIHYIHYCIIKKNQRKKTDRRVKSYKVGSPSYELVEPVIRYP